MLNPHKPLPRPIPVFCSGERLGSIETKLELNLLRGADPKCVVLGGQHPVIFIVDIDAWQTIHHLFRLTEYMSDDYAYREGATWNMAKPGPRLQRGVCLERKEAETGQMAAFRKAGPPRSHPGYVRKTKELSENLASV